MLGALGFVARHGRWALVLGLLCGLLVPSLAAALKPWLAELVLVLLFLTGLRVGPQQALSGLKGIGRTLAVVLGYQLALPLLALAAFAALGLAGTPYAVAFTLMLAAPSVTGSPNIAILLGHAPEPAFRLLILGTALLPLTVVPVFWLSPALGDLAAALWAAAKLLLSIWLAIGLAFGVRHLVQPELKAAQSHALDGVMSIALAVIVVGLMSAVGPALQSQPWEVLRWLLLVLVANLGLQGLAYGWLRRHVSAPEAVPFAIVAGNRNVALFFVALPVVHSPEFLIFLGCYQIPMYLTAIVMRPLFLRRP